MLLSSRLGNARFAISRHHLLKYCVHSNLDGANMQYLTFDLATFEKQPEVTKEARKREGGQCDQIGQFIGLWATF